MRSTTTVVRRFPDGSEHPEKGSYEILEKQLPDEFSDSHVY